MPTDVLITDAEYVDTGLEAALLAESGLTVRRAACRTADEVVAEAQGTRALMVQYAPITTEVLAALPGVRVVSRYGTGYDNIDVSAATDAGVWVANVPAYGTDEVPVHTLTLMLGCARGLPYYEHGRRHGRWPVPAVLAPHPRQLAVGVLGAGRIGRRVIELALPFFGEVRWCDPFLQESIEGAVRADSLDELLAASHLLTIHLPLDESTRHLVTRRELGLLREPRILVNAARGAIVEEASLVAALEAGELFAAGLDVIEHEPADVAGPLLASERVLTTPHAAWASQQASEDVRRATAANVVAYFRDGRPATPVNEVGSA